METIDRLGWAAGFTFTSYGVAVGVRVTDPGLLPAIRERLPPDWAPSSRPVVERLYSVVAGGAGSHPGLKRFGLVYGDALRLARSHDMAEVLEAFVGDLQLYVAAAARRKLFVHAGVVAWRGRAIVIPGASHSGKSRLVEALLRAGGTYYSDEYAVFDGAGRVHPYPIPLSLRQPAGGVHRLQVRERTPGAVHGALPVGLIVVARYRRGARWRPRRLSAGEAVLALLAHTVPARLRPQSALRTLERAAGGVPVLKGARGEADQTVGSLIESLEATLRSSDPGRRASPGASTRPPGRPGRARRRTAGRSRPSPR